MTTLREALERAQSISTAVGHFNVADLVLLRAVFTRAETAGKPSGS
jgi:fructose/tagatose bisphosphate aldolase